MTGEPRKVQRMTTQESNYVTDRLMELMGTEVGKEYTDELLIAMLCIQINELEGELATERETTKMSSICDQCAIVGCIFQAGIEREKCAFYKNKDDLRREQRITHKEILNRFKDNFPFAKVDDYRPICHELFTDGKEGITIWLDNGDVLEYYPKESEE